MRKLILQEFVTVDGYASDIEGKTDFFESLNAQGGQDVDEDLLKFIGTIDTILMGANTYHLFVNYWPTATTDKEVVADALNITPKIVFSKRLDNAPWGKWESAKVVKTDASEEIKRLKQLPGKNMVLWGSISLAQSLIEDGLIDEIQLRLCPVALGNGKKLFPKDINLNLIDTKAYNRGVILLRYNPK